MEALERLAAEFEEADRPEIDHDTRGVPGIPEIATTILEKIERAAVFVADVTPIAVSAGGKHVANPNVMIELGYAKKAVGTDRIILVWNTALTGTRPEDLPFDLRHRRAPISFALEASATRAELGAARSELARHLHNAIAATLSAAPAPAAAAVRRQAHEPGEPSVWLGAADPLPVNTGDSGGVRMRVGNAPRGYARLIPTNWERCENSLQTLQSGLRTPIPVGRFQGLDWGATRGGLLVYRSSTRIQAGGITPSATRWFRDNGEFWGVDSSFFTPGVGHLAFSNGYAAECLEHWLRHNAVLARQIGASGTFDVSIGIDVLEGTIWGGQTGGTWHALEDRVQHDFQLSDTAAPTIALEVSRFINKAREAYGLPPLRLS